MQSSDAGTALPLPFFNYCLITLQSGLSHEPLSLDTLRGKLRTRKHSVTCAGWGVSGEV
jgi:hypothetical protein